MTNKNRRRFGPQNNLNVLSSEKNLYENLNFTVSMLLKGVNDEVSLNDNRRTSTKSIRQGPLLKYVLTYLDKPSEKKYEGHKVDTRLPQGQSIDSCVHHIAPPLLRCRIVHREEAKRYRQTEQNFNTLNTKHSQYIIHEASRSIMINSVIMWATNYPV